MMFYRALSTLILAVMMTSQAVAEEVCLDGTTVMGIKGLVVDTQEYGRIIVDVDFRFATAYEVYGFRLDKFPFDERGEDNYDDAVSVHQAINMALNANNPIPDRAGNPNQPIYFIGIEQEGLGFLTSVGSEVETVATEPEDWDLCISGCTDATREQSADEYYTFADLSKADGLSCSGGPVESYPITPGITGSWFDPARNGEGYNIEIIGPTIAPQIVVYFYTYDDSGNQMWVTGLADIDGETVVVPMMVTSGAFYGDAFDPDDVIYEDWGTLTFTFSSCDAGVVEYVSTGFGSGAFDIVRLTAISGSTCP